MHSRKLLSVTDYSSFQLLLLICALLATSWVCGYSIYFIIADANWILGDNELIVSTTVVGKLAPTLIGAGGGRFWPLGFQEFNLFIAAGDAPYIYYAWQALKFIAAILTLSLILLFTHKNYVYLNRTQNIFGWVGLCLLLMVFVTAHFVFICFGNFIYPESTLIVLILFFLYFYLRAVKTDNTSDYVLSLISANLAIYLKEPVFGSLIVAVVIPYFLSVSEFSRKRKIFSLCVVLSGVVFVVLYYFIIFKSHTYFYSTGRNYGQDRFELVLSAVKAHPILLLLGMISFVRFASLFRKQNSNVFVFDGLLYSGIAYFFAFVLLNMDARRYLPPMYAFVIPSIFYYFASALGRQSLAKGMLVIIVLAMSLSLLIPVQFPSWQRETELTQARRLSEIATLLELKEIAEGNKIYLLGSPESLGGRQWQAKVLNVFLKYYGYEGSVENSSNLKVLPDLQDQPIIIIHPDTVAELNPKTLLEDANYQPRLALWGLRVYTTPPVKGPS